MRSRSRSGSRDRYQRPTRNASHIQAIHQRHNREIHNGTITRPLGALLFGGRRQRNESELDVFLDNPVVQVLPVDSETSRQYAEIVAELRKAGTPIPTNDIWIAAIAARHRTTVLTCDDHFERIGRVGSVVIEA